MFDGIAEKTAKKLKTIIAADLWCGGGGSSTGLMQAANELGVEVELTAVNHWEIAVATHSKNHPNARHLCKTVDSVNPLELFGDRKLDLLLASPECVHHSRARGGKPRDEQKRADVWDLTRWIEKLYIKNLLIENVREFVDWGPLGNDGKPLKSKKGVYFKQFIEYLKVLYTVEWRVLNCADYGDATTRERFFLIAKRGKNKKISFPEPTHASRKVLAKNQPDLFAPEKKLKPWVSAREIINWNLEGKNIFGRKKDLSPNTIRRIYAGLRKYSGIDIPERQFSENVEEQKQFDLIYQTSPIKIDLSKFTPFLFNQKATDRRMRSIENPCFTQTANSQHQYLVQPYMFNLSHTQNNDGAMCKDLDAPLTTICGKGMFGVVEPYLVPCNHGKDFRTHSVAEPLKTITGLPSLGIANPFFVQYFGGMTAVSVDNPVPTICANYEHYALVESFLTQFNGTSDAKNIDSPVPTITTKDRFGLGQPFMIQFFGEANGQKPRIRDIDSPVWTVTPQIRQDIVEPFLVKIEDAKGKEIHGLLLLELGCILVINFRMLHQTELAKAMSFPDDYYFHGTRDQQVKQIGNAVPVKTAEALCRAILEK